MCTPSETTAALEQYKLMAEAADRISALRQRTNTYFVSVGSLLIVANSSDLVQVPLGTIAVSTVTVLISLTWWRLLASYHSINKAKFTIIHEIEETLPYQMFAQERVLYRSEAKGRFKPLSKLEQAMPVLFALLSLLIAYPILVPYLCSC